MSAKSTLTVRVVGDAKSFSSMTKKVGGSVGKLGKTVAKAGAVAGAAAAAAGVGLLKLAQATADYGDTVAKGARATGLSTTAYQELGFALGQTGIDGAKFDVAMKALNKRVGEAAGGNKMYQGTLDDLGVELRDTNGELRSQDDIFTDVLGGLEEITSSQERAAAASTLFGAKIGPELASAVDSGVGGIQELRDKAQELGIVMSEESAVAAEAFNDRLDDLKKSFGGLARDIGEKAMPVITKAFEKLTEVSGKVKDWWAENGPAITERVVSVGKAVKLWWQETAVPAIAAVGTAIKTFWNDKAKPALASLKAAWADNKLAIEGFVEASGRVLRALGTIVSDLMGGIAEGVGKGTGDMEDDFGSAIRSVESFTVVLADLLEMIGKVTKSSGNVIKLITGRGSEVFKDTVKDFNAGPYAGSDNSSFSGSAPSRARAAMRGGRANGGNVSRGAWLVGERGPEMLQMGGPGSVTPLSGSGGSSNGDTYVTVNAPNYVGSKAELMRVVKGELAKDARRGGTLIANVARQ
jgi:hypothetical protein